MKKKLLLSVMLTALIVSAAPGDSILSEQTKWHDVLDCSYHLHWNHYYVMVLTMSEGEFFKFQVTCDEGRYFDIMILDEKGLSKYKRLRDTGLGTLDPLLLRTRFQNLIFYYRPKNRGRYYLLVDNTRIPDRGHFHKKKFNFRIRMWEEKYLTGRVEEVLLDGEKNMKYWMFDHE
ncbi:MAG: hypothetical protein PHQ23_01575 [Candidatus Wallbacteria bacterium]|nr:hypothetical protein [Candidatus Wallbacteria bacterium]